KCDEKLVLKIPFDQAEPETINQIKALLSSEKVDAVLFSTNYLALSGLMAIKELGREIDKDFLIIAYDDRNIFKLHTPQISAIEQPVERIAENVIQLILNELELKTQFPNQQIILPTNLILR